MQAGGILPHLVHDEGNPTFQMLPGAVRRRATAWPPLRPLGRDAGDAALCHSQVVPELEHLAQRWLNTQSPQRWMGTSTQTHRHTDTQAGRQVLGHNHSSPLRGPNLPERTRHLPGAPRPRQGSPSSSQTTELASTSPLSRPSCFSTVDKAQIGSSHLITFN